MILNVFSDGRNATLINFKHAYDHDDDTDDFLDIDDVMKSAGISRTKEVHDRHNPASPLCVINETRDLMKIVSHYKKHGYTHVDVCNEYSASMMTCNEFIESAQDSIDAAGGGCCATYWLFCPNPEESLYIRRMQ